MKTLTESLNFSQSKDNDNAVFIRKHHDVNYYETLCLYCANNNVNTDLFTDNDFSSASDVIEDHQIQDDYSEGFYFWID